MCAMCGQRFVDLRDGLCRWCESVRLRMLAINCEVRSEVLRFGLDEDNDALIDWMLSTRRTSQHYDLSGMDVENYDRWLVAPWA